MPDTVGDARGTSAIGQRTVSILGFTKPEVLKITLAGGRRLRSLQVLRRGFPTTTATARCASSMPAAPAGGSTCSSDGCCPAPSPRRRGQRRRRRRQSHARFSSATVRRRRSAYRSQVVQHLHTSPASPTAPHRYAQVSVSTTRPRRPAAPPSCASSTPPPRPARSTSTSPRPKRHDSSPTCSPTWARKRFSSYNEISAGSYCVQRHRRSGDKTDLRLTSTVIPLADQRIGIAGARPRPAACSSTACSSTRRAPSPARANLGAIRLVAGARQRTVAATINGTSSQAVCRRPPSAPTHWCRRQPGATASRSKAGGAAATTLAAGSDTRCWSPRRRRPR